MIFPCPLRAGWAGNIKRRQQQWQQVVTAVVATAEVGGNKVTEQLQRAIRGRYSGEQGQWGWWKYREGFEEPTARDCNPQSLEEFQEVAKL
jgi:hypothetical protein